jgi:PAS domain S-box-containing protein
MKRPVTVDDRLEHPWGSMLNRLPVGVVLCDGDGKILFSNETADAMLGGKVTGNAYCPDQGYSLNFLDGTPIPPEDLPIPRALKTGLPVYNFEILVRQADGGERIVSASVETDVASNGALCVLQDKKQREEELKSAHKETRDILESITDGFFSLDRQWRIYYLNSEAEKLLNTNRQAALGRSLWEIFPEAVGTRFQMEYQNAMEIRSAVHFEEYYAPLKAWFEVHAYPGENGLSIYFRDISERKLVEEALRQSEERFRTAFESAGTGITHVGLDGKWIRVNHRFCEITGYSREELQDRSFAAITHPDDLEADLKGMQELLAGTRAVFTMEKRYIHRDGRLVWANLTSTMVRDNAGRPAYFIKVVEDISRRKQAEEETRIGRQRLELLAQASHRLLAEDDPQNVLRPLCEQVLDLLNAQVFFNYLTSGDEQTTLALNASGGLSGETAKALGRLDYGQGICGTVAEQARPIAVERIQESSDTRVEIIKQLGLRSYACFPLLHKGRVLGTMAFGTTRRDRFEWDELAFLESFCNQVAIAQGRSQAERELLRSQELLEQKVAERTSQLLQHSELLETVIDNIPVMLTYYRPSLQFLTVNKAFERLTGWSRAEAASTDLMSAVYPDDEYRAKVERFMAEASGEWRDFAVTTRSGGILDSSWANVRLSDGSQIGIGVDIRDRKASERQLQKLNQALRQRTVELQELALQLSAAEHKERRRLAQFLHDNLQQMLFAAKLKLSLLGKAERADTDTLKTSVDHIESIIEESIQACRSLTYQLNPPVLAKSDFRRVLLWLAEDMQTRYELKVDLKAAEELNLASSLRRFLFEAVRELLFNALKHSGVRDVSVSASREGNHLRVAVQDCGKGFEPGLSPDSKTGFGLYSIRERTRLFGGQFDIRTAPGQGSEFTLIVPVIAD